MLKPDATFGFAERIPVGVRRRIEQGVAGLREQFVVDAREVGGAGQCDPLGEAQRDTPALVRKYGNRALLLVSGKCPVHCRYCFRRHESYTDAVDIGGFEAALTAVAGDPELREVILSGGDPLMVSDARLFEVMDALRSIEHVRRLRIHTRMPVVTPGRIGARLVTGLAERQPVWVVVHINHPNELDQRAVHALRALGSAGVPLLSQSVLLRGINDRVDILAELFESLVDLGVRPYYLHALDPVAGAAHFAVSDQEGRALMESLRRCVSGIAMPTFVREVPGAPSKVVVRET